MKKLLIIRFVKFENALVGQQLGVFGREFFERSENVGFLWYGVDFAKSAVFISVNSAPFTKGLSVKYFDSNDERDEYFDKVVKWISEEQFAQSKPKIDGDVYTWSLEVAE